MPLVVSDLAVSLAALVIGPLAFHVAGGRRPMLAWIDGFVLVTVMGLVFFTMLPEALIHGGWWVLLLVLLGAVGPNLFERFGHGVGHPAHAVTVVVALLGLGLHSLIDGGAIATGRMESPDGINLFGVGVALHRLPVGFTIWWLTRARYGHRAALGVLAIIASGTLVGAAVGPAIAEASSGAAVAWFQGLVSGSLLHVVLHRPALPKDVAAGERARLRRWEGAGAILGLGFLVALVAEAAESGHGHLSGLAHPDYTGQIGSAFLGLALESAPALLLAYLIGGLASTLLPDSSVAWMARGRHLTQATRGVLVGLPLPICSCGVVPLYQSLIKRGAPPAAAMAFLVATPELGLDAVFLSFPLLGGPMAIVRVAAAGIVALLVGMIVGRLIKSAKGMSPPGDVAPVGARAPLRPRILRGLRTGVEELVDQTAPWILMGLAIAAVAAPLLEGGWLARVPGGIDVPLFALLGLPTYVCASAATPMVAALLAGGVSPGAAIAFLLTGPATNATTFGVLASLHGRRVALWFSATIITLSVGVGYLVNAAWPGLGPDQLQTTSPETASPLQTIALALLIVIVLYSVFRRGARGFLGEISLRGA